MKKIFLQAVILTLIFAIFPFGTLIYDSYFTPEVTYCIYPTFSNGDRGDVIKIKSHDRFFWSHTPTLYKGGCISFENKTVACNVRSFCWEIHTYESPDGRTVHGKAQINNCVGE